MPEAPPPGPQGAPMAQPMPNDGARQMGMVQVETAMQLLEQALPTLGSNTPEGAAVLKAMSVLSKPFNRQQAQPLVPARFPVESIERAESRVELFLPRDWLEGLEDQALNRSVVGRIRSADR